MAFFGWLVGTERWWADYTLSALTVGVVAILGGLYALQTKLIYVPDFPPGSRRQVWRPSRFGIVEWEEVWLRASDGVKLHAFWIPAPDRTINQKPAPTVLMFHANAGNMGHRLPLVAKILQLVSINFLVLSYRGYGESGGSPNEKGIRKDSQAALDYILSEERANDVDPTKIIVYGQSIGGAVAIDLVARNQNQIAGIVVENTFRSIPKLIPHLMPLLSWCTSLCHQVWDTEERLREIIKVGPPFPCILFLSGSRDELIPSTHIKTLYKIVKDGIKDETKVKLEVFEKGTHNDTCLQAGYFNVVADFIQSFKS